MAKPEEKQLDITDPGERLALLQTLQDALSKLPDRDYTKLDALLRRAKMIIGKLFGPSSPYLSDIAAIRFQPSAPPPQTGLYRPTTVEEERLDEARWAQSWNSGKAKLANLVNTAFEDLNLSQFEEFRRNAQSTQKEAAAKPTSNNVFIVHGHDNEMKLAVALVLKKLGLEPIILHELPDKGRTVIEKFIDSSLVQFAVILLSADDFGYPKDADPREGTPASASKRHSGTRLFHRQTRARKGACPLQRSP